MRIKLLFVALVLVALGSLTIWGIQYVRGQAAQGRNAANEFHVLYNAGNYVLIYDASHPRLRKDLTELQMRERLGQLRNELGALQSIDTACFTSVSGSNGRIIRIEFVATFERDKAWETFDWQFENGKPALLAFAVERGWENPRSTWELSLAPRGVRPQSASCAEDDMFYWWED